MDALLLCLTLCERYVELRAAPDGVTAVWVNLCKSAAVSCLRAGNIEPLVVLGVNPRCKPLETVRYAVNPVFIHYFDLHESPTQNPHA